MDGISSTEALKPVTQEQKMGEVDSIEVGMIKRGSSNHEGPC